MRLISEIILLMFAFANTILPIKFDGQMTVRTDKISFDLKFIEQNKVKYTTTDEIAKISQNRFYSAIKRKESIYIGSETYIFSPNNRFIVVSEATYDMGDPTIVTGDAMFIPLIPFLEILAIRTGKALDVSSDIAVFVDKPIVERSPITPRNIPPETSSISNSQILIEERDTLIKKSIPPAADTAKNEVSPSDTFYIAEVIEKKDSAVIVDTPKPEIKRDNEKKEKPTKKKWLVLIDPGHGGKDPGASGSDTTREKGIVLDISKKLKSILEKDTLFSVDMTRTTDRFIELRKRTQMANDKKADIFVSIHCNASRNRGARGTQVFFLAPAKSDMARATAALENASIFLEEPSESTTDLDFILADIVQNEFLRESSRLGVLIEEAISGKTGIPARGPAGAGFFVLNGAFMPAVLVETAFISNADDLALLKNEKIRTMIAEGIAEGIAKFIEELPK